MRTVTSLSRSLIPAPDVAVHDRPLSDTPVGRRELSALHDELMLAMEMISSGQKRVRRLLSARSGAGLHARRKLLHAKTRLAGLEAQIAESTNLVQRLLI